MNAPDPAKHLRLVMDDAAREFYRRLDAGELATTRCPRCRTNGFPPRLRCPRCDGPQEWVALPWDGRLHAFTSQETALRFAAPTVLALAELGEAIVPGIVEVAYEVLRIGEAVRAEPFHEPAIGLTLLRFAPR